MLVRISSFFIYVVTFAASYYCIYAAQINSMKRISGGKILYLWIAALLPCIIAGLRADTVGVDVGVYIVRDVQYGVVSRSLEQLRNLMSSESELLYCLLVYISTRITSNAGMLLFLLQLLSIVPCLKAFLVLKERINVSLAYLIYLFYFYNTSLNLMRQTVACSFILLGAAYWHSETKNKHIKATISFIVASLFHRAAIIGIIILLLLNRLSNFRGKQIIRLSLFLGICCLPTLLMKTADYLIASPAIPYRYKFYLSVFTLHSGHDTFFVNPYSVYTLTDLLFRVLLVIVPICFIYGKETCQETVTLENICMSGLLIYGITLFSMKTAYGSRVSMFLDYFVMLLAPQIITEKQLSKRKFIFITILIMSWFVMVMCLGSSGSQNYVFRFF